MPAALRRPRPWPAPVLCLLAAFAALVWATMPDAPVPDLQPGRHVVDALEHPDQARLEGPSGAIVVVPRGWLPAAVREGDVLTTLARHDDASAGVRFAVDEAATEERRRALQERRDGLPQAPSGDLEL